MKWQRASAATHLDSYVRTMLVRTFVDDRRLAWARVRLVRDTPDQAPPAVDGGTVPAAPRDTPARRR